MSVPAAEPEIVFLSAPTDFQMADEWYEFAVPGHFWFQWRFRVIERLLPAEGPPGPVLEVGCGNGVARSQIEERYGCPVDGCDVNLVALRRALPGKGKLYFYDIHQQRAEWQGFFSMLILLDTLEHIDEPDGFLRSVAYHLKPGGLVLINVPALQSLYSRYDEAAGHVNRYNVAALRNELQAAGFSIVRHAYWGFTLLPVALARKCLLRFASRERTIQQGFQPGSRLVDAFLRTLMRVECGSHLPVPIGTSLVALARKEDMA